MKLIFLILSLLSVSYAQVVGDIKFIFVGTGISDIFTLTSSNQFASIKNTKYFDPVKPSVLIFHGWFGNFATASVQTIVPAYLKRGDHNIIVVDWGKFAIGGYVSAVESLPNVANFIANILNEMRSLGLDLSKVHLVGHSLGAQMAGMIGTNFKTTKNFVLCRITGLDPAGPFFMKDMTTIQPSSILMPELGRNDAKFVDIIHTDANGLGSKDGRGHIDFFPNGGNLQAGCRFACLTEGFDSCLACSHSRSYRFYAESVTWPVSSPQIYPFTAKECPVGATSFTKSNCVGPRVITMGYYVNGGSVGSCTDSPTFGNYFLETNSSPPYSK